MNSIFSGIGMTHSSTFLHSVSGLVPESQFPRHLRCTLFIAKQNHSQVRAE
jgi:hypothetical protein